MKRKLIVLLLTAIIIVCMCGCSGGNKGGMHEIYIYDDYCFYLHVPIEYENEISQVSSRNVLINFSSDVYLSVKVFDYYSGIDSELKKITERKEFQQGSELLDDTYNNQEYVVKYADSLIKSMIGVKNISGVTKVEINGNTFWVVSFEVYTETTDAFTHISTKDYKGEGEIYLTVKDGYLYQLMLCANNGYISDSPDAVAALNDFHIGTKIANSVVFLWILIGVLILACVIYIISQFVKVEVVEDKSEPETSTKTLEIGDIRKVIKDDRVYTKAQKEQDELLYKLDVILGRIDAPDFDIQQQLETNAQVREKLDIIMKEHGEPKPKDIGSSDVLDMILERGAYEKSEETASKDNLGETSESINKEALNVSDRPDEILGRTLTDNEGGKQTLAEDNSSEEVLNESKEVDYASLLDNILGR